MTDLAPIPTTPPADPGLDYAYLREEGRMKTYFKSRLIGEELGMSAKEVGTNMTTICEGDFDVDVEKWGYSSGTTWKVSV